MTQPLTLPAQHGITAATIGQDVVIEIGDVTYEGRIAVVVGDDLTLDDCARTAPRESMQFGLAYEPVTITLTVDSRVWLDLSENDFTCVDGVITLADDGTLDR